MINYSTLYTVYTLYIVGTIKLWNGQSIVYCRWCLVTLVYLPKVNVLVVHPRFCYSGIQAVWLKAPWVLVSHSVQIKGIVSRDKYFLAGPKIRNFLNERLWFSQYSVVSLWRKSKMKFLLASMKWLTNCNPLQRACSAFLIAACAFKSPETSLWFWKWFRMPAINVH